jgi:hypothetical protein
MDIAKRATAHDCVIDFMLTGDLVMTAIRKE